jgi:osmotically-inducible protein OsmY
MNRYLFLALFALAPCGCESQDREHLDHIARKVAAKVSNLTEGTDNRLQAGWQAFRGDLDQLTLDLRVAARIRWDKSLQGAKIDVAVHDGAIDLKGTVRDADQRRHAVELAEQTVGANKVNDALEVPSSSSPDSQ